MQENEKPFNHLIPKSNTILDLLNHEVLSTIGADKTLNRIERVLMQPEVLNNLSFEQLMQYMDRKMRRQKEAREFIIDFYRVNSKSQDIQAVLKQYTMIGNQNEQNANGEVISVETEQEVRAKLLLKLDKLLKAEAAEKGEEDEN